MIIGSKDVILCHRPSFMGCEENILPMRVYRSEGMGNPRRGYNRLFELNDLAGTGFMGGDRFRRNSLFVFTHPYDLEQTNEINNILESYGKRYAFFFEKSQRPLEEGYLYRCRFVREDIVQNLYPQSVDTDELIQSSTAIEILYSFFEERGEYWTYLWLHKLREIYGDYYCSNYFYGRYNDDEQFSLGGAVWEERDGIFRAWMRVVYIPK